MFLAAWRFRHFIISSIVNDFRARFIRSRLGALWMILHPLAQVAIFALILSTMLSAKLSGLNMPHAYAIYLMAGTLSWSLFSEIILRSLTIFIDNSNLIKKISFPKISLLLITLGSALVSNLFLLVSVMAVFLMLGHIPGIVALYLPLLIALTLALSAGIGVMLGTLNVFMRDIGQIVPIAMQFLFWATPVVYVPKIVPEHYRHWLELNPVYHLVSAYQDVLVFGVPPQWSALLWVAGAAAAALAVALALLRKASPEMVDVL